MPYPSRNRPERANRCGAGFKICRVLIRYVSDFWLDGKAGNMVKMGAVKLVNFRPESGASLAFLNKPGSYGVKYEPGAKSSGLRIDRQKLAGGPYDPIESKEVAASP